MIDLCKPTLIALRDDRRWRRGSEPVPRGCSGAKRISAIAPSYRWLLRPTTTRPLIALVWSFLLREGLLHSLVHRPLTLKSKTRFFQLDP